VLPSDPLTRPLTTLTPVLEKLDAKKPAEAG